jgi:hypothetical protein
MTLKHFCEVAALAAFTSVAADAAHAEWTVTSLDPTGSVYSQALAASGGQQAGIVEVGGVVRASLWIGTAASWINLNPAESTNAYIYAMSGGQQVGFASVGGVAQASLWSGTADSWVSLHPQFATSSTAYGVSGEQQVGHAGVGGVLRASLWSGTAASWVDLSPANATRSEAFAIGGGQQVGYALVGGMARASLWSGTAASWVDLSPAASTASYAYAISGGQQAGIAYFDGETAARASLWSGTAASWVDLSPAGSAGSYVFAMSGGEQVGGAVMGGDIRASLWRGTAASWVDLHAFLPPRFAYSVALGISSDTENTYVVGWGQTFADTLSPGRPEALLWTRPRCEPTIASQPLSAAACTTGSAMFSVTAGRAGPFTYQWRRGGVPIDAVDNPSAITNTLTLTNLSISASGEYDCVVTNACGSATSAAAVLTVAICPCGLSDIAGPNQANQPDGQLTADDIIVYLAYFFIRDARADVAGSNQSLGADGEFTADDIIVFLSRYFAGC